MGLDQSNTGGVKAFSIAGRMCREKERLLGMTDEERRWRAQWLKDQILSDEEPKFVPEYYKATNNIFRRIWQFPAYQFQNILKPVFGENAALVQKGCSKLLIFIATVYILSYGAKYHTNDFTKSGSIEIWQARGKYYPDEPNFPYFPVKTPQDYYDLGFYSSVLCQDVSPPEEPLPPPVEIPPQCGTEETQGQT